NLLQLLLPFVERNIKNVAADVAAHHFHHLSPGDVGQAGHFDVVAGIQAETPRVFAVTIEGRDRHSRKRGDHYGKASPQQAGGGFLGERTTAGGYALLRAQKWRFLLRVQVEQASVVELFARQVVGRGVQLFLDGGTAFSRHLQVSC